MAIQTGNTPSTLVRSANKERATTTCGATLCTLVSSADTAGAFVLLHITVPAFWNGCVLHWHAYTTEMIYVVHGTLACTLDAITTTASPGTTLLIPPGVVHAIWNPTAASATYIAWSIPAALAQAHPAAPQSVQATLSGTSDVLLADSGAANSVL